jgi:oligopeptide transport system substrate-binding protein
MKTRLSALFAALTASFLVLTLIVVAQSSEVLATGQGGPKPATLDLNVGAEPATLDPAKAEDIVSFNVIEQLFIGLVDIDDDTAEVKPELATSWEISADGTVYTFTLRSDAFWNDGNPITAHDVRYGILRSLTPAPDTGFYSTVLAGIIQNGEAFLGGTITDPNQVGVKALDDTHLRITMPEPAAYSLSILAMGVARPMPQWAIEAHGVPGWTEPANIVTSGPYRLAEWVHGDYINLEKNTDYYDASNVKIDQVKMWMVDDNTAWQMYLDHEFDTAVVPVGTVPDQVVRQEIHFQSDGVTRYSGFSVAQAPFDDPLVRKAFVASVDRAGLVDDVIASPARPALTFTAPGIFGHVDGVAEGVGIPFDPALARQWLADAGYPNGLGLADVTLTISASATGQEVAEYMINEWSDNLGVTISLVQLPFGDFLSQCRTGQCQMWRLGWGPDYFDAYNYLHDAIDPRLYGNWSNPTYEALLDQATQEPDPGARKGLYKQAEEILVESDAVQMPLYYGGADVASRPYLKRTYPIFGYDIATWRIARVSAVVGPGGGRLDSYDGDTSIEFPPAALTATIVISHTPASGMPPGIGLRTVGQAFDLTAVYSETGEAATLAPGASYTMSVQYTDEALGATFEDTLALHYWDGSQWIAEPSSVVDTAANTATARPDHFSLWALIGENPRTYLPAIMKLE